MASKCEDMLRSESQIQALNEVLGEPGAYMDERLAASPKTYAQVIEKCIKTGILSLTLEARSTNSVFFVKRKDQRQRMILDCRKTNRMFLHPLVRT